MMAARHERALTIAKRAGAEAVLAADLATVTWLTGYGGSIETGASPFGLPPLGFIASGEAPVLIVTEDEAPAAEALGCSVAAYPGYSVGPLDPVGHAANALTITVDGRAVEAVRPGVVAGDLDALMRDGLSYPHHSGHGIGTSYHEEPRIVPGWPTVLEPGMVLALEPGWYGERDGIRLEWIVLVTEDGCEVLSRHDVDL